ncbi:ClC family H(+)/Cl(-) exchange transporter [Gordonia sp. 'Campus']|uniref:ClC family H(+)/Cl(-) exchange transporter n=1 Tax=Gordonia sp. 'Campus' TaxID=2915824 RepID=UPI001EE49107|nr:ClC family H(+)/Cl(-) exchange transporter [Gordonia sp. 'Campus']
MMSPQTADRGMVRLCVLAVVAGLATGLIGGAFRWCLEHLERWRHDMLEWSAGLGVPGWFVPIAVTAAGATAGALAVRLVPTAAGSGIQHVEAVERGEATAAPLRLIPAKFAGALAAIGSGLVLGREGPTVHMGAVVGAETARRGGLDDADVRVMQTSMSGAGLAVAFTAPIGGALFALEEVGRSFRLRLVVPTVFAVVAAVAAGRLILGDPPEFVVPSITVPSVTLLPVFVVFGLLSGLIGIAYSRVVLGTLGWVGGFTRVPPMARAAVIGAVIGALLAADARTAGGGDDLTQAVFDGGVVLPALIVLFLVRFVAGPLSYAAGTPGGLFAPLLALGALWGATFAEFADVVVPLSDAGDAGLRGALILAGMAALFGAVVRAPLTGMVVVMEMTATTTVALPMLAATAAAVLVAHMSGSPPVYDSLRERMLATSARREDPAP